jgi:sugar lactone lactonase YvrE
MSGTTPQATCVVAANNHLGETPLWSCAEQALYWINCEHPPQVHRWHAESGAHNSWPMPQRVGGIALQRGGKLLVVLARGIYDFDPASAALTLRCASPLPPHVSLHECQCDRQGRLWAGAYDHHFTPTTRDAKDATLLRLDGNQLMHVIDGISVANGMAISPDGNRLYFADAPTRRIECFDLDAVSGDLTNRRTFVELPRGEGFVDGATVDAEGGVWVAAVGSGSLRRYLPDGTLERIVTLPVSNPTNLTFGGKALDTLYFTTTKLALGANSEANGGVYSFKPGICGLPEPLCND